MGLQGAPGEHPPTPVEQTNEDTVARLLNRPKIAFLSPKCHFTKAGAGGPLGAERVTWWPCWWCWWPYQRPSLVACSWWASEEQKAADPTAATLGRGDAPL